MFETIPQLVLESLRQASLDNELCFESFNNAQRRTTRQCSISRIHRIGQCEIFSCRIDVMQLACSVSRRVCERSN